MDFLFRSASVGTSALIPKGKAVMTTSKIALLQALDIGNSVAEFDYELDRYFLETNTFQMLIDGKIDVVAGDKGSGKTAIYMYMSNNTAHIASLKDVIVLPGFNPSGSPVFQRLVNTGVLTEGQYATVWKTYILSLIGNWALQLYGGVYSDEAKLLDALLRSIDLRSPEDESTGIFSRVAGWAKRLLNPKTVGMEIKFDHTGIPIITPQAHFADESEPSSSETAGNDFVTHEYALGLLNSILTDLDAVVWLALDRLDEAFLGYPDIEIPALRALFRTYLDLLAFSNLRMKVFVRRDLFSKVSKGGFVNLTHINARKAEIIWDDEDLFALICRRVRRGEAFLRLINDVGLADTTDRSLFAALFPSHLDTAQKGQSTWNWMLSRTRDGNGAIQPRNLLDLIRFSRDEQLRREQFSSSHRIFPLIGPEALKRAYTRLSKQRVEDTLLAESSQEVTACIEGLRDGKSEHNEESLTKAFRVDAANVRMFVKVLGELGLLEQIDGHYYKVPMLYREGLNITQGKAYAVRKKRQE